ncbi:hypothetical protein SAMN05444004_12513 [Jannaschia faecimaris]|uniref:Cupin domain-containing protein n=1 Tax=Jannaschia faecimaris TaxID=1244108 RepID=A0A1H3U754_9RHOB|nr:hypothetical protein [Jannaschia faecimaris]SDZ58250.1 hypothetical protein SAMN05444004_12513 [Jannaschia faecimaris]
MTRQETGWHHHDVPLFADVLDGEMTVDYGPEWQKTYAAGGSLIKAFHTLHNGVKTGCEPLRILAVFLSSETATNTVMNPLD